MLNIKENTKDIKSNRNKLRDFFVFPYCFDVDHRQVY